MNLRFGIVGLPNVGKSTIFNILTKSNIRVDNFPFSTIKPNIKSVSIVDNRIKELSKIVKTNYIYPTSVEVIDIAGLIKGASDGKGLGNYFLYKIQEVEAIIHVVRCFEDKKILHVLGDIDPIRDIKLIEDELSLFDMLLCDKIIHQTKKKINPKVGYIEEISVLEKCMHHLNSGNLLKTLNFSHKEKQIIKNIRFLTIKPVLYVLNMDLENLNNKCFFESILNLSLINNSKVTCFYAKERFVSTKKNKEMCINSIKENKFFNKNFYSIINYLYDILDIRTFFTVEKNKISAFVVKNNTTAKQAASKVHTDFGKGFIRAQIISFVDFIKYNGDREAKRAGKAYLEGRNYIIKDGDIVKFLFKV